MKLKEIIVALTILLPIHVVFLVPFLAFFGLSRLFELFSDLSESCALWIDDVCWRLKYWVLVVTGIVEKESDDEL